MIPFLVLGLLLGAFSVMFILQNITVVTVAFFSWQITGSLALILLCAILSGMVMMLLVLLPSLIRDKFYLSAVQEHKREVENELASTKQALVAAADRSQNENVVVVERIFS